MDRMRESLFAILGDLTGCSFLDLFSGSGIIGIEAASRGASPVTLVEKDGGKRAYLTENTMFIDTDVQVVIAPVERFILRCNNRYDLIFLDPPFKYRNKTELIEKTAEKNICAEGGIVIIHHPREDELPDSIQIFTRSDKRVYGRSVLSFYTV
jgi:16S rRNA (guanine966-N2)-methyltransferase